MEPDGGTARRGGRKPNRPFVAQPLKRHPEYSRRLEIIEARTAAGMVHRDIARELGVSRQRVTQLASLIASRSA